MIRWGWEWDRIREGTPKVMVTFFFVNWVMGTWVFLVSFSFIWYSILLYLLNI